MRKGISIFILAIIGITTIGSIYAGTEKSPKPPLDSQVRQLTETLKEQIIPPVGTSKAEVDKIYGEPKETKELPPHSKGSSADYPLHSYQLLDPIGNDAFCGFLYITYRDGKVHRAGVNHSRVVKGRPAFKEGSGEINRETRWALADLLEIYNKYEVTEASWNASGQ